MHLQKHQYICEILESSARNSDQCAFVMIDVVNFTKLNAEIGYDKCDLLLQSFSQSLRNLIDHCDSVIHYYADKFIIILDHVNNQSSLLQHVKFIKNHFNLNPLMLNSLSIPIEVLASACCSIDTDGTGSSILKCLEWSMSLQKDGDHSTVVATREKADNHFGTIGRYSTIREALKNGEMHNRYHPIIDIRTGQITGAESLVRWINPTIGLMLPNSFLPIIEENRQLSDLTRAVLSNIIRDFELTDIQQLRSVNPNFYVSFNVPPSVLLNRDFIDSLLFIMRDNPEFQGFLAIEITEQNFDAPHSVISECCLELKEHGIKVFIDDFGNGYSSISRIAELPIDAIKLDRMFLMSTQNQDINLATIMFAIDVAQKRDIEVIFEGVTNAESLALLQSVGAKFAQGFYYSKPLSISELMIRYC